MALRAFISAMVVLVGVSLSPAAISIEWVGVDNSSVLTGYKTFDLYATTDNGWCCNAMLFPLDTGTFYQHPIGGTSEPLPTFVALFPELEFDTYLGAGGDAVRTTGQAGDVGGDVYQFDETELDVSWAAQTIPVPLPTGRLHMARITFSNDATGSWVLAIAASEQSFAQFSGTIEDIVPEPGTLGMLVFGVAALAVRQKHMCR